MEFNLTNQHVEFNSAKFTDDTDTPKNARRAKPEWYFLAWRAFRKTFRL